MIFQHLDRTAGPENPRHNLWECRTRPSDPYTLPQNNTRYLLHTFLYYLDRTFAVRNHPNISGMSEHFLKQKTCVKLTVWWILCDSRLSDTTITHLLTTVVTSNPQVQSRVESITKRAIHESMALLQSSQVRSMPSVELSRAVTKRIHFLPTIILLGINLENNWFQKKFVGQNTKYEYTPPPPSQLTLYRVYKKKLNKFEIALNVAKRLKVWSFWLT